MINLISARGKYLLYRPYNSQDMNYHLVDTEEGLDYLIDICDVYDVDDEGYGECGLSWEELKGLEDMDTILAYSWKVVED